MKLLVDIGNTNTSIGVWKNSKLSLLSNVINQDLFNVLKKYYMKDINEVLIISVINNKENKVIKDKLKKVFKCKITQMKSSSKLLGITNGYKQPTQLGDDRWVTVVASYLQYKKPLIIVDCGTAISIDCVNSIGKHLGGYILSGFNGYSQSFYNAEKLKKIKLHENNTNKKLLYAKTTSEALLSGYALMVTSAIEKTYSKVASNSIKKPLLIMSGGYAKQILSNLTIKSKYEPNLVLKCLGFISDKK
jgi:type III pantothenate kinase